MANVQKIADSISNDCVDLLNDIVVSGARRLLEPHELRALRQLESLGLVVQDPDTGALCPTQLGEEVHRHIFIDWDLEDDDPYMQGYDDDF